MGVEGEFSDVDHRAFMNFAERHEIPFAKRAIKEIKSAIALWPDFARLAGLSKTVSDGIREKLA
jgi:hypothetical protein